MTAANLVQSDLNITTPYSRYALNFDSASSDYIAIDDDNSIDLNNIDFFLRKQIIWI